MRACGGGVRGAWRAVAAVQGSSSAEGAALSRVFFLQPLVLAEAGAGEASWVECVLRPAGDFDVRPGSAVPEVRHGGSLQEAPWTTRRPRSKRPS